MAEALLGLGSTGASSLNQELIDKLKAAERKATVEPIETDIENITSDIEKFDEVNQAVLNVLDAIRPFDLFITGGTNAFEEKSASTTGTSVVFDATDVSALNNGMVTVDVTQIGQKDVFQSNIIDGSKVYDSNGDAINFSSSLGNLTVTVGEETLEFVTGTSTDLKAEPPVYGSYDDLVNAINNMEGLNASIDEVSPGSYRMIIKSSEVGVANEISFFGDASILLGFNNDVYTSGIIITDKSALAAPADKDGDNNGLPTNLTVNVDGVGSNIDIEGKTYQEIVDKLNEISGVNASIDGDGATPENFTIKVTNDNGSIISLSGAGANSLGLKTSSRIENNSNNILQAQDMKMTVDGVEFEAASNKIVVDGLTINATTTGTSTITIEDDTSYLTTQINAFVEAYNALAELVDDNTQADSEMYNKTGLKAILNSIKDMMFSSYGEPTLGRDPKSIFEYGIEFNNDLSGKIVLNETRFAEAVADDLDGLRQLFIGTAARDEDLGTNDRGFGTLLKEMLDGMFFSSGLVSQFETSLTNRQTTLETDLEKAEKTLDTKYDQLTAQFSAYASIITQFETAFGGLKMMIDQSVASD